MTFRIVVNAVDERDRMINKFQGDAALAVFGAPLHQRYAASVAGDGCRAGRVVARAASWSISESVFRRARCSRETSAPKTDTSTR